MKHATPVKEGGKGDALRIALIGSFKQYYQQVLEVWHALNELGIEITSPKGSQIIEDNCPFVRFESDDDTLTDAEIQTIAMHRILRADVVYAITPNGYVGRTTCYEIGRIVQCKHSLLFSEPPSDLPIKVPTSNIVGVNDFISMVEKQALCPRPISWNNEFESLLCENLFLEDEELRYEK